MTVGTIEDMNKPLRFTIDNQPLARLVNESLCKHGATFKTTVTTSGATIFEFESVRAVEKAAKALPQWSFEVGK